ncbi:MAG: phosphonate ABC transporter, permease protein PhnE [Acidimicrobiales bacterium]
MTATTERADEKVERPHKPPGQIRGRVVVSTVILILVVWSVLGINISIARIVGAPADIWDIVKQMIPPNLEWEYIKDVLGKVMESIYIAWIGTIIGAVISLPLAFAAAANTSPRWIQIPVRIFFSAVRAFPELILAIFFLPVVGLGPWAGALAIGLHSVGTLGKLSTEAIESLDGGPMEAVDAAGGKWSSKMRWAVMPQVMPVVVALWLFRFEINIRASAVLGLIGAGGVGSELVGRLNFREFDKAGTVLLITAIVVIIVDTISASVRRRLIRGSGRRPEENATYEAMGDLTGIRPQTGI